LGSDEEDKEEMKSLMLLDYELDSGVINFQNDRNNLKLKNSIVHHYITHVTK
jgi:hypothetical protein